MKTIKCLIVALTLSLTACATHTKQIETKEESTIVAAANTQQTEKPVVLTVKKVEDDLGNIYTVMERQLDEVKQKEAPVNHKVIEVKNVEIDKKTLQTKPVTKTDKVEKPSVSAKEVKADLKPVVSTPGIKLPALPKNAVPLIPLLKKTTDELWPDIPYRSYMGAKIEQESCISLTHSKCWSPYAELKTKREYGFGFGQTTIAYKADGVTERFNVWKDLRAIDPVLKAKWTWENRFDAELQMRALLVKSKMSHHAIRFPVADETEHLAFGSATYNSGSVLIDRRICIDTKGCDPSRWFGNVELYSTKSKVKQPGYGKSFFEISRDYPRNILFVRRPKYAPYLDD